MGINNGRTATILFFVVAGWISIIAWARTCLHEQNKYLRDLEVEIDFFNAEGGCEQGGQQ